MQASARRGRSREGRVGGQISERASAGAGPFDMLPRASDPYSRVPYAEGRRARGVRSVEGGRKSSQSRAAEKQHKLRDAAAPRRERLKESERGHVAPWGRPTRTQKAVLSSAAELENRLGHAREKRPQSAQFGGAVGRVRP